MLLNRISIPAHPADNGRIERLGFHRGTKIKIRTAGLADMVVFSIDQSCRHGLFAAALEINPIEICFTEVADGKFSNYAIHPQGH